MFSAVSPGLRLGLKHNWLNKYPLNERMNQNAHDQKLINNRLTKISFAPTLLT